MPGNDEPPIYPYTLYFYRVTVKRDDKTRTYRTKWRLTEADAASRVARGEWTKAERIDSDSMVIDAPAGRHFSPHQNLPKE